MANNYLTFSEVLANLSPDEEAWIEQQLEPIAIVGGKELPYELGEGLIQADGKQIEAENAEFAGCRAYRDMEGYDFSMYGSEVGFEYAFDDSEAPPDGWGRHLWLYTEEGGQLDLVAHLIQKFLKTFRPNDCWWLTYATTCSRPRVGEFGGGALFVTAHEIDWQNTCEFVEKHCRTFKHEQDVLWLVKRAGELGIQPKDLDDLADDAASVPASEANDGRLAEQIALLVEQHGAADAERLLDKVASERRPRRA